MANKLKLKPAKILKVAIFPLIAVFSVGFILFLRPFDQKTGKIEEQDSSEPKD